MGMMCRRHHASGGDGAAGGWQLNQCLTLRSAHLQTFATQCCTVIELYSDHRHRYEALTNSHRAHEAPRAAAASRIASQSLYELTAPASPQP